MATWFPHSAEGLGRMIPTKTSLVVNQSLFEMSFGDIMCCQMFYILWHELGGCLVSQARCLSICSLTLSYV